MFKKEKMRQYFINITLALVSLAISLFAVDLILKTLRLPKGKDRVMLLSGSTLSTDEHGVRRYESNKVVEQSGYIDSKLAYRYQYRTNNLGFVSEYDYSPGERLDLLITGDSMTEGQEVGPWLDEIQKFLFKNYKISSQNAGIAGNGFVEFERVASFAKSKLNAKKAMIIFIADDMYRFGDTMLANQDCSTYKSYSSDEINCHSGRPTWYHYRQELSDAELVSYAENQVRLGLIPSLKKPALDLAKGAVKLFCKTGWRINSNSSLATRINGECDTLMPSSMTQGADTSKIPAITIDSIRKILQAYGVDNVLMVMIPGGGHSFKEIQPQNQLDKIFKGEFNSSINFVDLSDSCDLPISLLPVGRHPTAEGYRKLQSCFLLDKEIIQFAIR